MATVAFLLIQLDPAAGTLVMDNLGSRGLFTAILVALVSVHVQKFFTDRAMVIRMPASVPPIVSQSFASLSPLCFLLVLFWSVRFVAGVDINQLVQAAFSPLVFALNTLPGILVYASLVTVLWSIGINGDNAVDVVVAPIFLEYLSANVAAMADGRALPYVTAYGFFTTFVNVGGTGATIALALLLVNSSDPGFRTISRMSLPTQIFQINEPIFFGLPIVLNPVFMIPYILNALILTTGSYLLMDWGVIHKPFVNVPWTTPPIIGHYLVSGGDWRAAVWGAVSIVIAMLVYFPFARAAERTRLRHTSLRVLVSRESCRSLSVTRAPDHARRSLTCPGRWPRRVDDLLDGADRLGTIPSGADVPSENAYVSLGRRVRAPHGRQGAHRAHARPAAACGAAPGAHAGPVN